MKTFFCTLTIASAALALSSCATSRLEYIDATIAPAMAQPGSVAIAGMVAKNENCLPEEREQDIILNRLAIKLGQKRKHLRITGHDAFEREVGPTRRIGSGYTGSLTFALSPGQVEKAKHLQERFALVISLSENNTWCDVDESCDTREEHIYDEHGHVIDCRTWTEYTTSSCSHRAVRAEYLLYDLSTGRKVWACSSQYEESRSQSSCSTHCYPPPPPHPAPPATSDVMENMAAAAIRKYPK